MAVPNPCCCCNLRTGTQVVAILNIIGSGLTLIFIGFNLILLVAALGIGVGYALAAEKDGESDIKTKDLAAPFAMIVFAFIVVIIYAIVAAVDLIASIMLLNGATRRDIRKCRLWIIVHFIFLGFSILETIIKGVLYSAGTSESEEDGFDSMTSRNARSGELGIHIVGSILGVLFVLYQIWVVYAFMDEVKREGREGGAAVAYQPTGIVYSKPEDAEAGFGNAYGGPAGQLGFVSPPPPATGIYPQMPMPSVAYPQQQPPPYAYATATNNETKPPL